MMVQAVKLSLINNSKDFEKKKQMENFVSFLMDNSFFDGLIWMEIIWQVTTYLQEDVFTL
jgi:hypothetical protein